MMNSMYLATLMSLLDQELFSKFYKLLGLVKRTKFGGIITGDVASNPYKSRIKSLASNGDTGFRNIERVCKLEKY